MAYLLDAAVIVIFVAAIITGYKRGFARSIINIVGFIAALVLAVLLSEWVANGVYTAVVQPASERAIETAIEDAVGNAQPSQNLDTALEAMPKFVKRLMERKGVTAQALKTKIGDRVQNTASAVAVSVTETAVKPVMTFLIRCIAGLVLFIILLVVAGVLERLLGKIIKHMPLLHTADGLLGGVLGGIKGLLWVMIVITVLQAIAAFTAEDAFISHETIAQTKVVSAVSEYNPLFSENNFSLKQFSALIGK